jgi:hypothetical protein
VSRFAERTAIRLARIVAGPERRQWVDAIEAELDHLPARRLDWALGSLIAATKDRAARERTYALALVALPTAALATLAFLLVLRAMIARATGLGMMEIMPLAALAPAPFAFALGVMRPRRWAWLSALPAFALYQAVPAIGFSIIWGTRVSARWEPNLSAIGLPPPFGLLTALVLWCTGAWLGGLWARKRRKRLNPPSP